MSTTHPIKWSDAVALLLALASFVITDPIPAGIVLALAAMVGCYGIVTHHNWRPIIQIEACAFVWLVAVGLFLYSHHASVARSLLAPKGELVSGNGSSPPNKCGPPSPHTTVLHLGSMFILVSKNPYPVLTADGKSVFSIERKTLDYYVGHINTLSIQHLQLFDNLGREAAVIDGDKYTVNSIARFERSKPNNLSVFDYRGDELLNVEYTNDNMIQIRGVFRRGSSIITVTDRAMINSVGGKIVGGTGCWRIENGISF